MGFSKWVVIITGFFLLASCEEGSMAPDDSSSGNNVTDSGKNHFPDSLVGCETREERELVQKIREYRGAEGLDSIPVSKALSKVADLHVKDLIEHAPHTQSRNCNLHSWSNTGNWSACCYTSDHDHAECMWDKPRELTDYEGDGFEIAYGGSGANASAEAALSAWKDSRSHNTVIINEGQWRDIKWEAMGVSIKGGFAVVWFGQEGDPEGSPSACKK